jgi:hypothetical protein
MTSYLSICSFGPSEGNHKESISYLPFGMGILFLLVYLKILSSVTISSWHKFNLLLIFR